MNANCLKHGHHASWCTTPDDCAAAAEEVRVERVMKAEEIFEEGFKRGLAQAGLTSTHEQSYRLWLLQRAETA